jgi:hypothetical protein
MATVDVTNQPVVVEATNDVAIVAFTESSVVVEVPNPQPVVEFTAGGTLTAGTGLAGGGYLTGNITLGLSAGSVASLAKADTAVQPGANLSSFVNDLNLATSTVLTDAIAGLSTVYQPLNSNLTAISAVATTVFGRSFLELTDAAASRSLIGVYSTSQVYTKSEVNGLVAAGLIPVWGTITGNILSQTDLQMALSAKSSIGHDHVASAITSGIVAPARLGSGTPDNTKFLRGDSSWVALSGDHGGLTGLGDDDHTQYHTDARGDLRYSLLAHTHAYLPLTGGFLTGEVVYDGASKAVFRNVLNTIGADIGLLGGAGDAGLYIYQRHNASIWFGTNNTTRMQIAANGVVNFNLTPTVDGIAVALVGHTHGSMIGLTDAFHSGSDFVTGTLVATDIDASVENGASFVIEITGKSYSPTVAPFKVVAQGYLYANGIMAASAVSYGGAFASSIKLMNDGGVLKVWWPTISYWNSFNVRVYNATGPTDGNISRNRVTGITNAAEPTGSKKISVTPYQSLLTLGGTLREGLGITTTGYHITMYDTDGPDPNDRTIFHFNGGFFNLYTHDYSADAWTSALQVEVATGVVTLGGRHDVTMYVDTSHLVTTTSALTGYHSYRYSTGTLSHYMAFNAGDYGFLNEQGNWTLRLDRSKNVFLSSLVIEAGSNTGVPALGTSGGSRSFLIRFAGDPNYGVLMGLLGTGDGWIQVQRTDAQATAYDLLLQPNGGAVRINGNLAHHAGNVVSASNTVFNNMGGAHGDVVNFNSVTHFGPKFIQSGDNGPTGNSQFYTLGMGLGSNYAWGTYGIQLAWPRDSAPQDYRPAFRCLENGTWTSWKIHAMSNVNSQFSVAQTFDASIYIAGSFYRTSGAEFSFYSQGSDTVYFTLRGGATPVMRGYIYGDGDGFGLLGNTGAWSIRIAHGAGGGIMHYNTTFFGGASNYAANNDGFYVDWANSRYIRNAIGNYGTIDVVGSKGGWSGIKFPSASGTPYLMFTTGAQTGGIYNEGGLGWILYFTGAHWQGHGGQALAQMSTSASCIIRRGTTAPTGGVDGDLYLQYT